MKVWITGAGGLIGGELVRQAAQLPYPCQARGLTHAELDLCDFAAVSRLFVRESPDAIIHCAANSRIRECDADPVAAWKINTGATVHLATLAEEIPFIFLSTDLVFDGRHGGYVETDALNPLNLYGQTKAEAETRVLRNPRHAVVRLAINFGFTPSSSRSFNEETFRLWQQGKSISFFTDEFRTPLPAEVTARALWDVLRSRAAGLYHLAGPERLSRYEIGQFLAELWPQPLTLAAGSSKNWSGPPRAADVSMNCAKLQKVLSFPLPAFSTWLHQNADRLRAEVRQRYFPA